jgi:hypothetical protein
MEKKLNIYIMRKIKDSEELSKYYHQISECVDDYIKNHQVKPTEIWLYIKKNFKRFLEKYNLSDIENIDKIIHDVLDHRRHMELDNVFYFEQYKMKMNESSLPTSSTDIEHEKVLADFFETSVGHVEVLDQMSHLFQIKTFDENLKAIIFSEEEVNSMRKSIIEKLIRQIYSKSVTIPSVDGIRINLDLTFPISEIVSQDEIKIDHMIDEKTSLRLISDFLIGGTKSGSISFYRGLPQKFKNYYIWELRTDN